MRSLYLILLLFCSFTACKHGSKSKTAATLFHKRLPTQTGIHFSNELRESESLNILTFEYLYNGAGVGAGDFNNDGLVDLFFSGNMVDGQLYINKGDFTFADQTPAAGISTANKWGTGVSLVDINQDGWLDLYLCYAGPYGPAPRTNQLYVNNGDLTFTEQAREYGLDDNGHTTMAAFFDYDRDGDLDVYLLTNITDDIGPNVIRPKRNSGQNPNTDRLYRNDEGVYVNVSKEAGILKEGYGLGVSITDINLDGWPDIFVSNDYLSNDLLYINNQDGTFTDRAASFFRHTSYSAMGNDVADLNHDGYADLIEVDMLPPDQKRRKLMIGSINYDRFRSEIKTGYQPQYMRNTVQLNNGITPSASPSFSEVGNLLGMAATDWSWSPLIADIDQDGWRDVLITNGYPRDITNMDFSSFKMNQLLGKGFGQNEQSQLFAALRNLEGAHLPNVAFKGGAELTFNDVSASWGFTEPSYAHGATLADLDGDADLDYVVHQTNAPVRIYENAHPIGHGLLIQLTGKAPNIQALGAKVYAYLGDQYQYYEYYPYRGYQSTMGPGIHIGMGEAIMVDSLIVFWPDGTWQKESNLDAGQVHHLTYAPASTNRLYPQLDQREAPLQLTEVSARLGKGFQHEERHYADFLVQPLIPHKLSAQGPCLAVGDLNGDGLEDAFVGGPYLQSGQLLMQQPNGQFQGRPLEAAGRYEEDVDAAFFDIDGDQDLDLYVASGGSEFEAGHAAYRDRVYLNDGLGHFRRDTTRLPALLTSTGTIAIGDVDQDGDPDVFIGGRTVPGRYPEVPQSHLLINDNGRLIDRTTSYFPKTNRLGMLTEATFADINDDGQLELIVVGEWMAPQVFQQSPNGFVEATTEGLASAVGWWRTLAVVDLDQDGDLDLMAGNQGLNTPFQASGQEPLRMYHGDFDENGVQEGIITHYLQGREVPLAYRDDLLKWMVSLQKRFPDYTAFAVADRAALVSDRQAAQAQVYAATTMASGWFEQLEAGRFAFHPFPVEAQFAPLNDGLVRDFNQDGQVDILLVGNDFGADTQTGRYDASHGLLLLGNGRNGFQTAQRQEAVVYAPGVYTSIAEITLDDQQVGILIGENGGKLRLFQRLLEGRQLR